jgi:type II secretory pathway pseudopilin PulG
MEIIRNVIRDIRPEYWVALGAVLSILSVLVAGFSLIYVRRSAKASREQTKQQKQAAKDAAQPMLWVDIRGDEGQGQALVLLLATRGQALPVTSR